MKRVNIYRTDNTLRASADMIDPTSWIDTQVQTNGWGLPERQVPDPNWQRDPDGPIEQQAPMITLPAEYRIEILDLPENYDYATKRASEYPPIADYVDALWHEREGDSQFIESYWQRVEAVKAKYPKPESADA